MVAGSEKQIELADEPTANIAFVPLAMPSTAGPGTIAADNDSFHGASAAASFPAFIMVRLPIIFFCRGGDPVGMLAG